MDIKDLIARRSDLSTFLVHLTRDEHGHTAAEKLRSILTEWELEARSVFGAAKDKLNTPGAAQDSQKCVCFTETPLDYVKVLFEEIQGRTIEFRGYGIAIPKKVARYRSVNPVWYVDITPGHGWLMTPINDLVDAAIAAGGFADSRIGRITPFIEQMGTHLPPGGGGYRKEFWWEREWRYVGDFALPDRVIVLCPEDERAEFKALVDAQAGKNAVYLDPRWGLEQIISRLAGFSADDTDML